jgi:hypothetical protein
MADAGSGNQDQDRVSRSPGGNEDGQRQVSERSNDTHPAFRPAYDEYASTGQPPSVNAVLNRLREAAAAAHDENQHLTPAGPSA